MIPSLENLKELEILIRFDCSLTNMSDITLNIFMKILENLEIENITHKYEPDWTNSDRYGKYGPNCWTTDQTNLIRTDWVGTKIWVGSNKIRTKISDRNPVPIRTGTVIGSSPIISKSDQSLNFNAHWYNFEIVPNWNGYENEWVHYLC